MLSSQPQIELIDLIQIYIKQKHQKKSRFRDIYPILKLLFFKIPTMSQNVSINQIKTTTMEPTHYQLIEFCNNFPRINSNETEPCYEELFPWGCSQLTKQGKFPGGDYYLIGSKFFYNIYLAIKCGIWSFTLLRYIMEYAKFTNRKNKSPQFMVFVSQGMAYGIARIEKFSPDQSFKYWYSEERQNNQHDNDYFDYHGVVFIKFLKLGCVPFNKVTHYDNKDKKIEDHDAMKLWNEMKPTQLSVEQFNKNDNFEEQKRNEMKDKEKLTKFIQRSHCIYQRFQDMSQKSMQGRENFVFKKTKGPKYIPKDST